jgi:hypothetical protein
VVRASGDVAEQAPAGRRAHRAHHREVGQVRAAAERVVEQRDIALTQLSELVQGGAHAHRHGPEVDGHVIAQGDRDAARVEQRARIVASLLDVGGKGRAAERGPHLLRQRRKQMTEHLESDRFLAILTAYALRNWLRCSVRLSLSASFAGRAARGTLVTA